MHMSWPEQLLMVFTLMLTSKGIAGVPRAFPWSCWARRRRFIFHRTNLYHPGSRSLIDMARTSVNVLAMPGSAVIAPGKANCTSTKAEHRRLTFEHSQ